jgi:hypothetical protein
MFIGDSGRLWDWPSLVSAWALMALNKSKKHYVGLTCDGDKKGGLAIQCDKNAIAAF